MSCIAPCPQLFSSWPLPGRVSPCRGGGDNISREQCCSIETAGSHGSYIVSLASAHTILYFTSLRCCIKFTLYFNSIQSEFLRFCIYLMKVVMAGEGKGAHFSKYVAETLPSSAYSPPELHRRVILTEYQRPKIFVHEKFPKTEDQRSSFMKNFRIPKTKYLPLWKISE